MQELHLKNKKFSKLDSTGQLFIDVQKRPRIPTNKCLIHPTYRYLRKNYNEFKVKRIHYKRFVLDDSAYYFYERDIRKPIRICRKMKYIQSLSLFSSAIYRIGIEKLVKSIRRLNSIHMKLGNVILFQLQPELHKINSIFRGFRQNVTSIKLEITLGYSISQSFLTLLTKGLVSCLRYMTNLKSFSLALKNYRQASNMNEASLDRVITSEEKELSKRYQRQFQRLKKIESLALVLIIPADSALQCFTESFSHFHNLRNLHIVSFDTEYGKQLIDKIKPVQSLNSVTFYYSFEPEDLITLASELKNLSKIELKDDWLFSSKEMPIPPTTVSHNNILDLQLDLPLDIDTTDDLNFIMRFLSFFKELRSLKIFLRCGNEVVLPYPIIKTINDLTNLQEFTFGISAEFGSVIAESFQLFKKITRLRKFSLFMKLNQGNLWNPHIQVLAKSIQEFLLRNKELSSFEFYWEKITAQCMDQFKDVIKILPKLKTFNLAYTSAFKSHGKNHEDTLDALENGLKLVNNIKEAIVTTACSHYLRKNCDSKGIGISKVLSLNGNFNLFSFKTSSLIRTPFYDVNLLNA